MADKVYTCYTWPAGPTIGVRKMEICRFQCKKFSAWNPNESDTYAHTFWLSNRYNEKLFLKSFYLDRSQKKVARLSRQHSGQQFNDPGQPAVLLIQHVIVNKLQNDCDDQACQQYVQIFPKIHHVLRRIPAQRVPG